MIEILTSAKRKSKIYLNFYNDPSQHIQKSKLSFVNSGHKEVAKMFNFLHSMEETLEHAPIYKTVGRQLIQFDCC